MKIYDPHFAHYLYCRDQEQHIHLFGIQTDAIMFHDMFLNDPVKASLHKAAVLTALLLTMSHALEKGRKPVEVAQHFFDAASISEAAPGFEAHNDSLTTAYVKGEKAHANAAYQVATNLMFLIRIGHRSLSSGRFEQQKLLKSEFFVALLENRWPPEYSAMLNDMLDVETTGLPNDDLDKMLSDAESGYEQQLGIARAFGDFESLERYEYALLG